MQENQQMLLDSDEEDLAALEVPKPDPNRSVVLWVQIAIYIIYYIIYILLFYMSIMHIYGPKYRSSRLPHQKKKLNPGPKARMKNLWLWTMTMSPSLRMFTWLKDMQLVPK
jgi:hypothetical protein